MSYKRGSVVARRIAGIQNGRWGTITLKPRESTVVTEFLRNLQKAPEAAKRKSIPLD